MSHEETLPQPAWWLEQAVMSNRKTTSMVHLYEANELRVTSAFPARNHAQISVFFSEAFPKKAVQPPNQLLQGLLMSPDPLVPTRNSTRRLSIQRGIRPCFVSLVESSPAASALVDHPMPALIPHSPPPQCANLDILEPVLEIAALFSRVCIILTQFSSNVEIWGCLTPHLPI